MVSVSRLSLLYMQVLIKVNFCRYEYATVSVSWYEDVWKKNNRRKVSYVKKNRKVSVMGVFPSAEAIALSESFLTTYLKDLIKDQILDLLS